MQRHRLFQFGLRTLLISLAALSVWLGLCVRNVRRQQAAVQAIQAYGGWVRYDFQYPTGKYRYKDFDPKAESSVSRWLLDRLGIDFFHHVVHVNLVYSDDSGTREENHNPSDAARQYLPSLPHIRFLALAGTQASDTGLRYVGKLKRLEELTMWDVSTVTDAGIEHLKYLANLRYVHIDHSPRISDGSLRVFGRMSKLEELSLPRSHFTDNGLSYLTKLTRLRRLLLSPGSSSGPCSFTNAGLIHLRGLTSLEELAIEGSGITDEGLKHCETLKNLKWVVISSNAATSEGLATLQAKLPTTRCSLSRITAKAGGDRN